MYYAGVFRSKLMQRYCYCRVVLQRQRQWGLAKDLAANVVCVTTTNNSNDKNTVNSCSLKTTEMLFQMCSQFVWIWTLSFIFIHICVAFRDNWKIKTIKHVIQSNSIRRSGYLLSVWNPMVWSRMTQLLILRKIIIIICVINCKIIWI